jgi:polyhydroxyalkanoate synthesis regulator phasin
MSLENAKKYLADPAFKIQEWEKEGQSNYDEKKTREVLTAAILVELVDEVHQLRGNIQQLKR